MLTSSNRCRFNITHRHNGFDPGNGRGGDYYGYLVDFVQEGGDHFQGVLAPNMRSGHVGISEWVLFPTWCVEIKEHPKEPVRDPAYEVDE